MKNKITAVIVILLLLIWLKIETNEGGFFNNKVKIIDNNKPFSEVQFPFRKPIYAFGIDIVDDSRIIVALTHSVFDLWGRGFLYNPKTNKVKRFYDSIRMSTRHHVWQYKDNLYLLFDKKDRQKMALYNIDTKEIKYFKGNMPRTLFFGVTEIGNSNILMPMFVKDDGFRLDYEFDYQVCNIDSMTCKIIKKHPDETCDEKRVAFALDSERALIFSSEELDSIKVFLYDINSNKGQRLDDLKFNSKDYVYNAGVYKKNHIYLLRQSKENGTEIILYKFENNKLIKTGSYICKDIPKNIVATSSFIIDEKRIILFGGSQKDFGPDCNYAYIFNTEMKKYTKMDNLPVEIAGGEVDRLSDSKWIIYGFGEGLKVLLFDKERLEG